jgi:hypothetical protein
VGFGKHHTNTKTEIAMSYFFNVWIEYIGCDNVKKRKFLKKINDYNDCLPLLLESEYIKEYLFMPKCIVILEDTFGNDMRLKPLFENDKFFLLCE